MIKTLYHNTDGSFTAFWALMLSGILICAGAAYDITNAYAAKSKAQSFADTLALTAAINIQSTGALPLSDRDGYVHNKRYNLKTLGLSIRPYVVDINAKKGENWALINYDQANGRLTATVSGNAKTTFMNLFGHEKIAFKAESSVDYAVNDINNSLSVALVLDTSGSMKYHDETGTVRQEAMEAAAITLMRDLETLVTGQEDDGRILRTGMVPYYSQIWSSKVVNMKWGRITDRQISSLYQGGGTNSGGSMERADTWMQGEDAIHNAETGRTDPKKYVIFMTDGANNSPSYDTTTLAACTSMKDAGVTVFTIGYALNAQTYGSDGRDTYTPPQSELDQARTLLSGCATSSDHFKTTDASTDLSEIFDGIGAEIAETFLRISH